jgi:FMN-dependent NADH-azoreductase
MFKKTGLIRSSFIQGRGVMMTVLFIDTCVREESRTKRLADYFLKHINDEISVIRPLDEGISGLDRETLNIRDKALAEKDFTHPVLQYAVQFAKADMIVIAAPYWDLMFPAVVKTYFENITVSGITFRYSDQGRPVSLCRAKELHYVTTSGGFIGENDFGFSYVQALARNFFGIAQIHRYTAEGLDIFGADVEKIMCEAKAAITDKP